MGMIPHTMHGGVHPDWHAPGTVTFVLRAPHKPYVSLVGDFNRWNSRANPLVTDGRGTWWTTIPHPGATRYGYFVAIDEDSHAWVGDPYATELRWQNDQPWAYLPAKPSGFKWNDGDWQTPALRDMVIYELCVRDFAGRWARNQPQLGNFKAALKQLDYLAELGINAIEIMPIQAFPGNSSWGYNPVFFFAMADVYGRPDDFKRFVDACHSRGIAVILDVAFNHAWGDHPYYHYYPPMYGPTGEWLTNWSPFFHHTPQSVNMWGGLDWDHFRSDTTRYFQDVVRHWLREYHIDGFRFDWVCGIDYDSNEPMRAGFHPYHGISAICWAAKEEKPDCVLVGEFWQLDGTHPEKSAAKLVHETSMDAAWNGEFHHVLDDVLNQRWQWEKQDIFRAIGGFREEGFSRADQIINYTCSHDEVRPEHEIKFYSGGHIDRPRGMTLNELALAKAALGLVILFTAPGVPMIYSGQEYGEDTPRTIDFLPLHWEKRRKRGHKQHADLVRRLIQLRRTTPALQSDFISFYDNHFADQQLVRYDRFHPPAAEEMQVQHVAVALNFAGRQQSTELRVPHAGPWRDVVSGKRYVVGPTHTGNHNNQSRPPWSVPLTLKPWQAVVLVAEQ